MGPVKAALKGSRYLATELGPRGIRVNACRLTDQDACRTGIPQFDDPRRGALACPAREV
jgi:NAD(P)-dependent dehydrogenase (short-subunit alcohol dehydrogenase family)